MGETERDRERGMRDGVGEWRERDGSMGSIKRWSGDREMGRDIEKNNENS